MASGSVWANVPVASSGRCSPVAIGAGRSAVTVNPAGATGGRSSGLPALGMAGEQLLQPAAQFRVPGAGLVEERGSLGRVGPGSGLR